MDKRSLPFGVFLVAVSAACFGIMPIFARMAYSADTGTYTLLFLRFTVGAACLFAVMRAARLPLPAKRDIAVCLLLGAAVYACQSFCYFTALNHASAGVVALLLYTFPAIVMLCSAVFLKEKITIRKAAALALALSGAFVIIGAEFEASPPGIALSLLSAVFYAAYILLSSRAVKPGMGLQCSAFIMLGAAVVYCAFSLITGFAPPQKPVGALGVVLIALISTGLAFSSFFAGMAVTGPTAASLISTLEPVVTVLSSALILAEPLTANTLLGGALVLGSLLLTVLPGGGAENPKNETEESP